MQELAHFPERGHTITFLPPFSFLFFFFFSFSRKKKSTSGLQLLGQWKGVPWGSAGRSNIERKLHPRPEIIFMYISLIVALKSNDANSTLLSFYLHNYLTRPKSGKIELISAWGTPVDGVLHKKPGGHPLKIASNGQKVA